MASGFDGFRAGILNRMDFSAAGSKGFVFSGVMKCRALSSGLALKEIPIRSHHGYAGRFKFSPHMVCEALRCLGMH